MLNCNLSTWRLRGCEKTSFSGKISGGLWLRQKRASWSSTVMMARDWLGRVEREKTAEGPGHSMSLLTQGVKLTDLGGWCVCFKSVFS